MNLGSGQDFLFCHAEGEWPYIWFECGQESIEGSVRYELCSLCTVFYAQLAMAIIYLLQYARRIRNHYYIFSHHHHPIHFYSGNEGTTDGWNLGVEGSSYWNRNIFFLPYYIHILFSLNSCHLICSGMHVGDKRRLIIPPSMGYVWPWIFTKSWILKSVFRFCVHQCKYILVVIHCAVLGRTEQEKMFHRTHGLYMMLNWLVSTDDSIFSYDSPPPF